MGSRQVMGSALRETRLGENHGNDSSTSETDETHTSVRRFKGKKFLNRLGRFWLLGNVILWERLEIFSPDSCAQSREEKMLFSHRRSHSPVSYILALCWYYKPCTKKRASLHTDPASKRWKISHHLWQMLRLLGKNTLALQLIYGGVIITVWSDTSQSF